MIRKALLLIVLALEWAVLANSARAQTVGDLLRAIQPGQAPAQATPAPAAPAPAPAAPAAAAPAPVLDTKPAFMSITTNFTRMTNIVVVTNYVVVTNALLSTNYFNAQGQMLMPVQPATAPLLAVGEPKPLAPVPTGPDPAVVRSNQVQAVREILLRGLTTTSNALATPGAFTANTKYQIRIPDGITVMDRKKGQNLITAMNTAAEKAVPAALTAVSKSATAISPADPAEVLRGQNASATALLLSSEGQNLANQVLAVVQGAAAQSRVPEAYNSVMLRGGGLLGAVLGTSSTVDINAHITKGIMEAIFLGLNSQEELLRTDPSAPKSKLLSDALAK